MFMLLPFLLLLPITIGKYMEIVDFVKSWLIIYFRKPKYESWSATQSFLWSWQHSFTIPQLLVFLFTSIQHLDQLKAPTVQITFNLLFSITINYLVIFERRVTHLTSFRRDWQQRRCITVSTHSWKFHLRESRHTNTQ